MVDGKLLHYRACCHVTSPGVQTVETALVAKLNVMYSLCEHVKIDQSIRK